jgi:hypothetical protein
MSKPRGELAQARSTGLAVGEAGLVRLQLARLGWYGRIRGPRCTVGLTTPAVVVPEVVPAVVVPEVVPVVVVPAVVVVPVTG